jgi:prepilin-type N-terminal cleavage/methylation domain-containing protein
MKRGFTLIELVAAIAVLVIVSSFAGVIFDVSVESHRTAAANAEIMQNLRVITDQLDADFGGLRTEMPVNIDTGYEQSLDILGIPYPVRSDKITFFANGDFQTTGQYGNETIGGNVAAIFYGLVDVNNAYGVVPPPPPPQRKILARRQTILTADPNSPLFDSYPQGEYYKYSLSEWRAELDVNDRALDVLMVRPGFNLVAQEGLVTYMARGVDDFAIEYEWWDSGQAVVRWTRGSGPVAPKALKFTFTLYDSRGIIEGGRTFTHIVYLGR